MGPGPQSLNKKIKISPGEVDEVGIFFSPVGDLEAGKRKATMSQVSRKHPGEGGRPRARCHAVLGLHLPCCVPRPSYRFTEAALEKKTSTFFSFSRVSSRPGCNSSFLIYCLTARPRWRGGVEPQGIFPEAAAQE